MAKPKKLDPSKIRLAPTEAEAWTAKQPIPDSGPA